MFQYVSLALVAVTAVFVLFNALKGLIRGLKKTIGTLAAIILSAVIAYIVTVIICKPSSSLVTMLFDKISELLGNESIQELFGISAIGDALAYYVSMIIAPIVFLALYMVLSIILSIVMAIVIKFIPFLKKKKGVAHRLGGVGVGVACGLLAALIFLTPVVGVLGIVVEVGNSSAAEDMGDVSDLAQEAEDDSIFKVYTALSGWLYDSLASAKFEGERVYLKKDIGVILTLVGNVEGLSGDAENFGDEQVDSLNNIIVKLDESLLLKHTVAGFLSQLSGKWVAGETFIGMERIDAGELLNPVLDTILSVMSTTNKEYVVSDLTTLTDMIGVFVKHDMLANSGDYKAMLTTLGEDGVMGELMDVANANPRMTVLSDTITQLSIRALASTIGIPDDADDKYNRLMTDIADALNTSTAMNDLDRREYVKTEVGDALDKYGVETEGAALEHITDSILADLGHKYEVSADDVSEFFTVYAIASSSSDMSAASGFDKLSSSSGMSVVINGDTIIVNGKELKNYTASNYNQSAAFTMGSNNVDFGEASTLYSAQAMHSTFITLDEILPNMKKYSECSNPDEETKKISRILSEAAVIFGQEEDLDKKEMLAQVGTLLDDMKVTEIFGQDVTSTLLKAILQSDDVKGELGLSSKEINNFADKLNSTANGGNSSYAETTAAVSKTIDVVDKINDQSASKEERREATEELMTNMSPENAELLSTMTTPSMMQEYGAKEDKAEMVSDSVSSLFSNMANYQSSTEHKKGDEEYAKEADAVNTVLQLAMDGAESNATSLFGTEGQAGKIDCSADEYVDLLANSDVVSKTLVETTEKNGANPYGVVPTADDEAVLSNAIVNYYDEQKSNGFADKSEDEVLTTLNAIAMISNITMPELGK